MSAFKPLLAATCGDLSQLRFPVLASPKLDGIRCVKIGGRALTRKLKEVPNRFVREWIEANLPDGIDGELLLRDHRAPFNEVSSAIMSKDGEPDFVFAAFDLLQSPATGLFKMDQGSLPFEARFRSLVGWWRANPLKHFTYVDHTRCNNEQELRDLMQVDLDMGYEGTMVRDPAGRYKFGRSTLKEGILLKIKPFQDLTVTVVGVVEQMHNENEATIDNLGHKKRSSAKAGKTGKGVLGALQCVTEDGAEFDVGSGFSEADRANLWESKDMLIGAQIDVKHQAPPGGRKPGEALRFPVFLRFRHASDC